MNVPNLLTLIRLGMTPFVIHAILRRRPGVALALFAAAAVTDILDGLAARQLEMITAPGAYLDPIADKCLLSGAFLAMGAAGIVPWWFVAIVFARDLYILLAVIVVMMCTPIRNFPPSAWGKASTLLQISTAGVWMGREALRVSALNAPAVALIWLSTAVTIWSGLHYTWRGVLLTRAKA